MTQEEMVCWIGGILSYLLCSFLAGIFSRLASYEWHNDFGESFVFICPLLGPLGLLISFFTYISWQLPKKFLWKVYNNGSSRRSNG